MKKGYYLLVASVAFVSIYAVLQTDSRSYEKENQSLEAELERWDPVRGAWLAESLEAMEENRAIPDRMFPEDLTPYQMISLLPNDLRNKVEQSFDNGELTRVNTETRVSSDQDQTISRPRPLPTMNQSNCNTISARSYGDPHLVTFDRARYSFQTVGEFVLTRSHVGMEVQTRQSPEQGDFSFNSAVAMNVGGDRVGIYARNYPDGDNSTPLRVNGLPVQIASEGKYFLLNGGIIRRTTRVDYEVYWPTGEILHTRLFNLSSSSPSMNINMTVTECGSYDGLLGNANGIQSDDFGQSDHQASIYIPDGDVFSGSSEEVERNRLTYIANALGDKYRVTPSTSLFDYPPGTSTYTFTDRSFPRVHRTVEEIPEAQKEEARKVCERSGVSADDMNGCIFDQAYLEIEPAPERRREDPTEGIVLRPIIHPEPNVNSGPSRPNTGGPITNGTNDRPSVDPLKEDRIPREDVRDPKEETDKEAQLREERQAEQYRLEEEERERQREERLREQEEQERQDRLQREREEEMERKQREQERIQLKREAEERAEKAAEARKKREEAERREREQREIEAREKREREERESKEEEEREAKRKADEKAKAEAERKRQEEARRKKAAAEKKAREEAARKAREEAERKRKEEAERKTRSGGR